MKIKKIVFDLIVYLFFTLFFLILLEISLAFIGKLILLHRQHDVSVSNKDNVTIACFGDSYTYGGLGFRTTSYPAYLNDLCKSANVENRGVCESNSTQVLNDIEKYIKTQKKLDIAIVLVGASNKYNCYGMKKYNFYQKFRVYKMFEIIKLSIKSKLLKKDIDKEFTEECTSGYYLSGDMNNIYRDLKEVDYGYGVLEEIKYYIAKLSSRSDSANVLDSKEKIKELLSTLSDEQKKLNLCDSYIIYSFLEDKQQSEYYYDLIYKKDPRKAIDLKSIQFLNLYFSGRDEEEKLKALNDIIKINPKFGYEKLVDFYIRKLPYIKDDNKKKETIETTKKYMDKYFFYEQNDIVRKQTQVLFYINNFEFDKAIALYEKELKNKNVGFDEYFNAKMAYCSVYCNNFSDAVNYFLRAIEISKDSYVDQNVGYYFLKSFDLQNKYSADYVLKTLDEILKKNDTLKESVFIKRIYETLSKRKQFEKEVLEWLEKDLDKIVSLCEKNNVTLIFQTYPFPYNSVNDTIKNICSANKNIILIDQNSIFQKLVEKDGAYPYFLDFDHCTEKGHYVMAENVYSVLLEKNLIKE